MGVAESAREAVTYYARALAQGNEPSKEALCILATEGVPEATATLHRAGVDAPLRAADAAVVAAGRCPLGDLAAQEAACEAWAARPLAALRAAAEAGDLAAMFVLGDCSARRRTGHRLVPALCRRQRCDRAVQPRSHAKGWHGWPRAEPRRGRAAVPPRS
jgi:TPR repeat protein